MSHTARRVSHVFLCIVPFLAIAVVGPRALRVPGVHQAIGGVLFAMIVAAAWSLGARELGAGAERARRFALAGSLLMAPFALVSLLWVGLATPWDATAPENVMRYLVLLVGSIAVTTGFVVLSDALRDAGERTWSTLGFGANMLAGPAYVIWMTLQVGGWFAKVRVGQVPPALASMSDVFDTLLFIACALTYVATATYAASLGRTRWLGLGATRLYVIANLVALSLLVVRGLSFPDPTAGVTPWYLRPGFIAGIPAVPWIMPFLLGVVVLRRAGDDRREP